MQEAITRLEAKAHGQRYYFTGRACKHGHLSPRLVSNGMCVPCNIQFAKDWAIKNRSRSNAIKYKWDKSHPEQKRARFKKWVTNHPAEYREALRAYNRRNMDYLRTHWNNKRARRRGAEGKHGVRDIRAIWATQGGKCVACQVDLALGYHVDHIVPLSKGGTNYPTNIQLLCPRCNMAKRDKDFQAWLASRDK